MTDDIRPVDPFAKLAQLGTDQKLFSSALVRQGESKTEANAPSSTATRHTPKSTQPRVFVRDTPRELSSKSPRENSRGMPTRDEIQEFSFRLRDELKVKVQAEVPAPWQDELEQISRDLDVKKLELYRYILGAFLGKVPRGK